MQLLHLRSVEKLVQIPVVLCILDALKNDVSLHVYHSHHLRLVGKVFNQDTSCTNSKAHIATLGFTEVSNCASVET